jgi:hypothetical protein
MWNAKYGNDSVPQLLDRSSYKRIGHFWRGVSGDKRTLLDGRNICPSY